QGGCFLVSEPKSPPSRHPTEPTRLRRGPDRAGAARTPRAAVIALGVVLAVTGAVGGCGGKSPKPQTSQRTGAASSQTGSATSRTGTAPTRTGAASSSVPGPPVRTPPPPATTGCVDRVMAAMTPAQRVGQLFMSAVST